MSKRQSEGNSVNVGFGVVVFGTTNAPFQRGRDRSEPFVVASGDSFEGVLVRDDKGHDE
jgi:hypothetical protein